MPQGILDSRVRLLECNTALRLTQEDHDAAGGFLHFCDDWDGLLIDQTDPEFDCCLCKFGPEYDPETGKAQG